MCKFLAIWTLFFSASICEGNSTVIDSYYYSGPISLIKAKYAYLISIITIFVLLASDIDNQKRGTVSCIVLLFQSLHFGQAWSK